MCKIIDQKYVMEHELIPILACGRKMGVIINQCIQRPSLVYYTFHLLLNFKFQVLLYQGHQIKK